MIRQIRIIGYVFAGIVVIVVVLSVLSRCDHKPVKVIPDRKATVTDSTNTVNQRKQIARLDSLLSVKNGQIITVRENLSIERQKNTGLRSANDSLSAYYTTHHTLQTCDSLVMVKQRYIKGLETEKDSLYVLTNTLTGVLSLERQKAARLDTMVRSKESVITAYARQLDRINCTSEWAAKHRFLAWLFGIKCYK